MVQIKQFKSSLMQRICQMLATGIFLFAASPSYAGYYGHHYGYGFGYGHYGGHFSYHGHSSDNTLGYVLLGLTGLVLLTHLFDRPKPRYYEHPRTYHPPQTTHVPPQKANYPTRKAVISKTVYPYYNERAGWDDLAKGNIDTALDIFAIQSQQNLNSGVYKIGFALAAAMKGELDRGTRAMRRALRIDPGSINYININDDIISKILILSDEYQATALHENKIKDHNFMIAALSFIQKDYSRADNAIDNTLTAGDQSQSTRNLKKIIDGAIDYAG